MNIESQGFCILYDTLYERLSLSDLPANGRLSVAAPTDKDLLPATLLGSTFYKGVQANVLVKTPYLHDMPAASYRLVATSEDGQHVDHLHHAVDFPLARNRSRAAYYLHRREFDAFAANATSSPSDNYLRVEATRLIGSPTHVILHGRALLPASEGDHVIRVRCLDASLSPTGERIVPMGSMTLPTNISDDVCDYAYSFSVRIPWNLPVLHVIVWDENDRSTCAVMTLSGAQITDMVKATDQAFMHCGVDPYYPEWFEKHKATPQELARQRHTHLPSEPTFSLVVPLFRTPGGFFRDMLASVTSQTYENWELILVNASPEDETLVRLVVEAEASDKRIKTLTLSKNLGISLNTNEGVKLATGEFVCFFDHDDLLEPNILFEYARAVAGHPDIDMLYCDEDKLDPSGALCNPYFKPDFNIDHLRNNNYICHLLTVRRSLLLTLKPNTKENDGAQDHNTALQVSERARRIWHVPHVLYHWRISATSTAANAGNKDYANVAGIKAVSDHLARLGLKAEVSRSSSPFTYDIDYLPPDDEPLVSVIIPSSDHVDVLDTCLKSILEKTAYANYEFVIVDNNSSKNETFAYYDRIQEQHDGRIRVVTWPNEFNFSKIINFGVEQAKGDYLLLLNNDTEVITPEWMSRMLGICAREDVGAVGVRLFYPDDTIQHAGVVVTDRDAAHLFTGLPRSENWGYFNLANVQRDLTAVTAACMMTKRSVFEKVGGFDERFSVAFNDVDYCLKLRGEGSLVVYTPRVELYHYESLSRGFDLTHVARIRNFQERAQLFSKWYAYYAGPDPNFTPNLRETITMARYYHF